MGKGGVYLHCRAGSTWLPCPLMAWNLLNSGHPGSLPTARWFGSKGSQARSITAVPFCTVGKAVSGRRPGFCSCKRNPHPNAHQNQAREPIPGKQVPEPIFSNRMTYAPLLGAPSSLPWTTCAEPQVPAVRPQKVRAQQRGRVEGAQAWGSGCLGLNPTPLTKLCDQGRALHLSELLHSHLKNGNKDGTYHMRQLSWLEGTLGRCLMHGLHSVSWGRPLVVCSCLL